MPNDGATDARDDGPLDDGLGAVAGQKRVAELPMLASLYLQILGPLV
jgi:hypothetical protein